MRTEREQSGTWRATNGDGAYLVGYETRALAMAAGTREWLGDRISDAVRMMIPGPHANVAGGAAIIAEATRKMLDLGGGYDCGAVSAHGDEIRASDPEAVDVFAPLRDWVGDRHGDADEWVAVVQPTLGTIRAMLAEVDRLREELRRATMTPRCSSGTPRAKVTASPTSSTPAPACWGMSRSRRRGQR